jgi:hypothetical protein
MSLIAERCWPRLFPIRGSEQVSLLCRRQSCLNYSE